MPNNKKDIDLDRGHDPDYQRYNRDSRDSRDSLDDYNDNLSKRAVGSIFDNIESGNTKSKNLKNDTAFDEDFTIDTNFSIQSNKQRKQLVSDVFADDNVAPKRKPKNAKPTRLGDTSPNPINSKKQLSDNNSAFTSDDDTLFNKKYVTRGNHVAVTPAMAAKRKNKTMMESQRIPTVTDEEIAAYKSSITLVETPVAKSNYPDDYDKNITQEQKEIYDYLQSEIQRKEVNIENTMHRINEKTKHYNEIIESTNRKYNSAVHNNFDNNVVEDHTDFNLSSRTSVASKNSNYLAFTDQQDTEFNSRSNRNSSRFNPNKEVNINGNSFNKNYFADEDLDDLDDLNDFDNFDTSTDFDDTNQIDISVDDLDKDFEDTVASNYTYSEKPSKKSRSNTSSVDSKPKVKRGNDRVVRNQEDDDFNELDSNVYVTKKTKFNTGEVTVINDTVATEISLEDLDELVFDNYDTTDMEFLRQAIKEKSQARKMQVIDEQFSEFEKRHRDFGNKNVPQRTAPKPRQTPPARESYVKENPAKENLARESYSKDTDEYDDYENTSNSRVSTRNRQEQDYNSYEYRKSQTTRHNDDYQTGRYSSSDTSRHSSYDTGRHNSSDTGRHSSTDTGRHNSYDTGRHSNQNTGRYNTSHTGRIPPTHTSRITTVDLDNDYDDYEDYSRKFNVSLIFNIIFLVALVSIGVFTFFKTSTLSEELATLSATNAELVTQNNKINELQIDVDYYKNLYQNTAEGKAALEAEQAPKTEESEGSTETPPPAAAGTTYTVQSGDTLSSIAKKVYGSSSQYQKIIDANKLTSDKVSIGQVLIIP